jgi:beta-glucosidase
MEIKRGGDIEVKVKITNTGKVAGEETVQLYLNDNVASVTRPVKELKAFDKVALEPGESKEVTFTITSDMLKFLDKNLEPVIEEGQFTVMVGGSSLDKDLLKENFYYKN